MAIGGILTNIGVKTDTISAPLPPPHTSTADKGPFDRCISGTDDNVDFVKIEDDETGSGDKIDS